MNEKRMAEAIDGLAASIRALGTGNAATQMGGLEVLAVAIKEHASAVASLAEAIRDQAFV